MTQEHFEIKRAERRQARLRLAIAAASGGGKTWTALELAFGICEQLIARGALKPGPLASPLEGLVGLIDTERKSAQLYSHLGPFDTIELGPPHTVDRYIGAQQALERAGCAVIIEDSISHAWVGDGGVLAILNRFQESARFSAFNTAVNPEQSRFIDALLRSPAHIIATMRSKTVWVLEDRVNKSGHTVKAPRRVGMAPIQRPGVEYEFTTLLNLDTDTHVARVDKNRCTVFDAWVPKVVGREHGRQLADWLLEGAPEPSSAISGTPLERLRATAEAAMRGFERCENIPDLGRLFEKAVREVRAFHPAVPEDELRPVLESVVGSKDARKQVLRPTLDPAPPMDPEPVRRASSFADMKDDIPW